MSKKSTKSEYGRFETRNYWTRGGLAAAGVSPMGRHVWSTLWDHAEANGVVTRSFKQLAEETGWSKRACQEKVNELIEKGVIKKISSGNVNRDSNTYALQVKKSKSKL